MSLGERDFDKKVIDFTNNPHLAPLVKPGILPVIWARARGAQLRRSQPAFIIVMVMKLVSVWESDVKTTRRTVLNPIDNEGQQLLVDWIGTYAILLSTAFLINFLRLITFRRVFVPRGRET